MMKRMKRLIPRFRSSNADLDMQSSAGSNHGQFGTHTDL